MANNSKGGTGRVVLAQMGEQLWLVAGEDHLDQLLMGQLAAAVDVELVPCAAWRDVVALWEASGEMQAGSAQPWAINPALMSRVLGKAGLLAPVVQFTAWSAAIDAAGETAIANSAGWLADNPGAGLLLRQFLPEPAPAGQADLQRLRGQLVRAALERLGVAADAVQAETAACTEVAEGDRLHIVTVAAA